MPDPVTGAGMGAINNGGNNGSGGNGAPNNPGGAPGGNGSPNNPNGSVPNGSETPWYEAAYTPLVTQKGWANPNDAIKAYQNLETLLGEKATAIVPPKSDATPEDWSKFYQRLGAPADPSGYKFSKEGMDQTLVNEATKWFHGAGMNDKQAEGLLKQYNDFVSKDTQKRDTDFMVQSNNELADLQTEWGSKFDDTVELARRATQHAMEKAGLTASQLNAFERAVGTKTLLKMMSEYGQMFKEGIAPGGEGGNNAFRSTPEFAKSEISRLRADPEFRTRYNHNDPTIRNKAIEEMDNLHKRAYGDAPIR